MFPGGWPGFGLFILRGAAAIPLFVGGNLGLAGIPAVGLHFVQFAMIMVAVLLLAGLWTPIAASLQAIAEISIVVAQNGEPSSHYLLAALGASLVMLGPGAWSVDARLFGRKRIDVRKS